MVSKEETCRLRDGGSSCVLEIRGRFDYNSHANFRRATADALALPAVQEYVVDLRAADYLDSSALGMLLNFNDAAQAKGRKVVLAHPSGLVQQILDVANFRRIFEIR